MPPTPPAFDRPWTRRASPLARALCSAWLLLVVYASLAPWSGWRSLGVGPLAFLGAPLPRFITAFDIVVNLLGYVPLGALLVLAVHPRLRGATAVLIASTVGLLLSLSIEALQTYLPDRVASTLDLAANTLGAICGAALTAPFASALIDRGRLAQLRARWFRRDAAVPLTLLALWPLAQIHPASMLFSNGDLGQTLPRLADVLGLQAPWLTRRMFGPAEFVITEAGVTMASVLGAGLMLATIMHSFAPRTLLLLAALMSALGMKSLAYGIQFGPERVFAWLTPGAIGGLLVGALALLVASTGQPRATARLALLAMVALLLAVNLVPENPYHSIWIQAWRPGRLTHFAAAAEWVSVAWPFAALAWLMPAAFTTRLGPRTVKRALP